jgi:hypothetical protein
VNAPDAQAGAAARRRVRLFVGAHLLALAALYALALWAGGGIGGVGIPPDLQLAQAQRPAAASPPSHSADSAGRAVPIPAWAQPAELSSPWDAR